ncbi:MAG: hypothetical protein AAGI37_15550 [Planctomycetota bacterium]
MALPPPTFDLSTASGLSLSGSKVTTWGSATQGTDANRPTYSDADDDKILGYGVVQLSGASSQYLSWDDTAAMFSGDDPDFTAAVLFRPGSASGAKTLLGLGSAGAGRDEVLRVTGAPSLQTTRRDNSSSTDSATIASSSQISYGVAYLAIIRQSGSTRSGLLCRVDNQVEVSDSGVVNVSNTVMATGAIGADVSAGSIDQFFTGDIARIRLYDSALSGDPDGDYTGTQIAELKAAMLAEAAVGGGSAIRPAIGAAIQSSIRSCMGA